MKAFSLFLVLAAAKGLGLLGREVWVSPPTVAVYLWQDAAVALLFGVLELILRRHPRSIWLLYGGMVFYAAVNIPLIRAVSSPLTFQIWRAAGGALSDSIVMYLTWETLCSWLLLGALAIALPLVLKNFRSRLALAALAIAGSFFVVLGLVLTRRIDAEGLHRNALVAFVQSAFPKVVAAANAGGRWRARSWEMPPTEGLLRFRGAATGRNVVLVLLESTGAQYLRPYGAHLDPTPNLSRMAEHSILFENAYCVYPESIKGLFSVLCSRYPAFDLPSAIYGQVQTPSLAQRLQTNGYRSALFHSGRFAYLGMEQVVRGRGFEVLEDAGQIGGNIHSSFGVDEPATVKRMLAWIDQLPRGDRFFLTYLPIAGHHPYNSPVPGPFVGDDERTHYLNALHYGDAALENFFAGLRRRGLETNTLFVIAGDHGESFGQHPGNHGHTFFVYEENVRVPCLVLAPGLIREAQRVTQIISLIDTAPTILDLLGLDTPADYQGISWLHGCDRPALFYTDYALGWRGLREGPWKFIQEVGSSRSRLFNLETDPGEEHNLAESFPRQVTEYRDLLQSWSSSQKWLLMKSGSVTLTPPQ